MGLHDKITLSFRITGHTRCYVDGYFGLIKQKIQRSNCSKPHQLVELVDSSVACNVPELVGRSSLEWREWNKFMA